MGLLTASLLHPNLSVALIDTKDPFAHFENSNPDPKSRDGRTFAVSYGSFLILKSLGLESAFLAVSTPIEQIRVSDEGSHAFLDYKGEEVNGHPLGYMVSHYDLCHLLTQALRTRKALTGFFEDTVTRLRTDENYIFLALKDKTLKAPVCVSAEGKRSYLRNYLHMESQGWAYQQKALVFNISHQNPHRGVAFEHFMPQGPLASLPYKHNTSAVVWSVGNETADELLSYSQGIITQSVKRVFQPSLGDLCITTPIQSFSLEAQIMKRMIHDRLAFIGDAAHVIHPLAGQGLNLGVRDAAVLAQEMNTAYRLGMDLGTSVTLEKFEKQRRFDNLNFLGVMDTLNRGFSSQNPCLKVLRRVGMRFVNAQPILKKTFAMHAMGLLER